MEPTNDQAEPVIAGGGAAQAVAPWRQVVSKYQNPSTGRAVWQVVNTIGGYLVLWYLIYRSLAISYWLTAGLAVLASGFLVRVFIIFHDCGHGSYFRSRRANDILGTIAGILTFTPYFHWRWEHGIHHSTSGDLDRRGTGDVWTLTVQEYLEASRWKRLAYRLARNPLVLFVLAPLALFLVIERIPSKKAALREKLSVHGTTLGILCMLFGGGWVMGWGTFALLQFGMVLMAGSCGVWLFYVQHQFEDVYWQRRENWDYAEAALKGSSFYKLPKILQWFSGNIGFHHIHHLSPRIPNYNLERCHNAEPLFQSVKPVTLWTSFRSLSFRLYDEQRQKLVGYKALAKRRIQKC